MADLASTVMAMAKAGCTADQIAVVVAEIDERRRAKSRAGNAKRQAEFRARKAAAAPSEEKNNVNNTVMQRDTPLQAVTGRDERDGLARARGVDITSLDSKNLPKETPPKGGSKKGPQHPKSLLDGSAQPTKADRELAERYGMAEATFRHEWDKFRTHHVSKGTQFRDWHLAWKTWALGWKDRGARQAGQLGSQFSRSGKNGFSEVEDFLKARIAEDEHGGSETWTDHSGSETGDDGAERSQEGLPFEASGDSFGRILDFRRSGAGGFGLGDDLRPPPGASGRDAAWR